MPRKKARLKIIWKVLICFSVTVLLITGIIYLVIHSNLFEIKSFNVSGSNLYEQDFLINSLSVEAISNKNYLGFITPSNTLFWLLAKDKGELTINRNLSYIEKAGTDINIFKGEVSLILEEKKFFGVICKKDNDCFIFDNKGVVLSPAPVVEGSLILRIDDVTKKEFNIGNPILRKEEWINNLFEIYQTLKSSNFIPVEITLEELELREFEVLTSSGPTFQFSLEFVPEDFTNVLEAIERKLEVDEIDYIDFRVPGRIYHQ